MLRVVVATALLLAGALQVAAQERPVQPELPPAVAREVVELYNTAATQRVIGAFDVDSVTTLDADLAVLDGPLTIAGTVTGRVVAINAPVRLLPGARLPGGLLVVGGSLEGRELAAQLGTVRVHSAPLRYREEGDLLVLAGEESPITAVEEWWERWRTREQRTGLRFTITTGKTYNRVEGLPIHAGPSLRQRGQWGEARVDALGIVRTANEMRWDAENLGHLLRADARLGRPAGVAIGASLYDVVRDVEDWQLSDTEAGLASALLRRDYRDYFGAHGGGARIGLFVGSDAELSLGLAQERWIDRPSRDPFSLFRGGAEWRPNPTADAGRFRVTSARLRIDTRNVEAQPWSGWYVQLDYERGDGRPTALATLSPGVRDGLTAGQRTHYGRGFLDVRQYHRVAPGAQVNVRAVLGGWLHGDPLPAQRRVSVGGVGSLPGFDARRARELDVLQCGTTAVPAGVPAQCDRMLLLQAEYRGDVRLDLLGALDDWDRPRWRRNAEWVVFVNTGRGWLVGDAPPALAAAGVSRLWVPRGDLPGLGSFRTDVGLGLDLGSLGFFVAKATRGGERANFFIRLRERF